MKILKTILVTGLGIVLLSGCGGCKDLSENSCGLNNKCLNIYKPCNANETGCKDNKLFTECRTKKVQN